MALHERFSEYTKEEVEQLKKDVCIKNKCPYLGLIHDSGTVNQKNSPNNKTCNYILFTGHMRNCMPDECTHYLDTDVKKKRFNDKDISAISNLFN